MDIDLPSKLTNGMPSAQAAAPHLFVQGVSPSMRGVESAIQELADSDVPVLILGEPGTGKRTTAERIHQLSARRNGQFRIAECISLSPEVLAGKGAVEIGLVAEGTIFLEEIGELGMSSQGELWERLSQSEGNGHGSRTARLICGTARDLEAEMRAGRFREDLYYRISGVSLRLPPLRQRKEDVPQLMDFFLRKYAEDFHHTPPTLSIETRQLFLDYDWPGNVRELEDAAKAIVALGDEALAMGGLRSLLLRSDRGTGGKVSLKQAAKAASRLAERELILRVLARTRWNRRRAAEELQISYKALLYKLKQIGYGECGAS